MFGAVFFLVMITMAATLQPLAAEKLGSRWANVPITVDGDANDWRDMKFTDFNDDNSAVGIMNDSVNLYLIVLARDEATIRQMETRGVTVWINPNGKNKKEYGLRYRGGMARSRAENRQAGNRPEWSDERREEILTEQARLRKIIEVFEAKQSTKIPVGGERGPIAAAAFGNNVYSSEFLIPLTPADSNGVSLRLQDRAKLVLGIHVGYMSDADKAKMKERFEERRGDLPGGGGDGPGMGGEKPMGGGGGMRGGPPPGRMDASATSAFWVEVELANQ